MPATKIKIAAVPQSVQIWERLEIIVGESGREGIYTSRVTEIADDFLTISRPDYLRGKTLLAGNRTVVINFTRADAAYSFSARIVDQEPKSESEMQLVELGKIARVQRRRFVRIDKMNKILYAPIPKPLSHRLVLSDEVFKTSFSHNISAGGILIPVSQKIKSGQFLVLKMHHNDLEGLPSFITVICRHVRIDNKKRNLAGLEFILREDLNQYLTPGEIKLLPEKYIKFDMRSQNQLTQAIFAEQLALRQKGLL